MKHEVIKALAAAKVHIENLEELIEVPKNPDMGDYALPCFSLAKSLKKSPQEIAKDIASKIKSKDFEKIEAAGPYVNFFVNKTKLAEKIISEILSEKEKYGASSLGKGKKVVIDMSAPNIAKPFGIGHLRSTIIGNSISEIAKFLGYKTVKINYLGDWGTQFGKLITGYKHFGSEKKLKEDPIKHLLEIYVKVNNDKKLEDESREWFRKMEQGDKEALNLWEKFKELSLKEFNKIYALLNIEFDVVSGESLYNNQMDEVIKLIKKKGLLEESEGAEIVNLEKYGLGVCLIRKKDGATLYATRDITAAIDRYNKHKFSKMVYEVGSEQKLHFQQVFKVLELLGFEWAKDCIHVNHGLYLDQDGKKFATRKGKTVFMEEVINETIELAKKEINKREKLGEKELSQRAKTIALSAIFYGDLKNYRANDMVFDIEKFLSFEGDTGPYLLYSYARANSIMEKAKVPKEIPADITVNEHEKRLISELGKFPEVVKSAYTNFAPNLVANYAFQLCQTFNEFYHECKVIGSDEEKFRLLLVKSFSLVLKNALSLLAIPVIEKM